MSTLKYDAEILQALSQAPPPQLPPFSDGLELRNLIETVFVREPPPMPEGVQETQHDVTSYDNKTIKLHRFFKNTADTSSLQPAILHMHGGGMISGSVPIFSRPNVSQLVAAGGVQIFSVEYRLAPEHPFPTPPEDCYAALQWIGKHHTEFNIDVNRIAVMGESAGGGLAAAVALLARDRKSPVQLAKQILIYPMLDDRTNVEDGDPLLQFLTWGTKMNDIAWKAYAGEKLRTDGMSEYAAPARVKSVANLPSTYIDTGNLDLFCVENITYAARLSQARVDVELHVYPGVPHAFEMMGPTTQTTKQAIQNRLRVISSL